jgi:ComEC/Rec2-related protein
MKKNILKIMFLINIFILIFLFFLQLILKTQISFKLSSFLKTYKYNKSEFFLNTFHRLRVISQRKTTTKEYHNGSGMNRSSRQNLSSDIIFLNKKKIENRVISHFFIFLTSSKHRILNIFQEIKSYKKSLLEVGGNYISLSYFQLISAMVFGGSSFLSKELNHNFKITGMLHIVSASGYNVSLVLNLALFLFKPFFSKRILWLPLLASIVFYSVLTDLSAAIIRASLMASLALIVNLFLQRQVHYLWILLLVSILMVLLNSDYLVSISFQLSVAATLGIILIMPRLEAATKQKNKSFSSSSSLVKLALSDFNNLDFASPENSSVDAVIDLNLRLNKALDLNLEKSSKDYLLFVKVSLKKVFALLRESFFVTLAAQSFTLPLVLYHFSELSLISFLANSCLLWLTPVITIAGLIFFFLIILFTLIPILPKTILFLFALFLFLPIKIFLTAVAFFSQFNFAFFKLKSFGLKQLLFIYLLLSFWLFQAQLKKIFKIVCKQI